MNHICKKCGNWRDINEVYILNCKHCFCMTCLEDYILNNMSTSITCPITRCVEKLEYSQLKEIISDEELLKYNTMYMDGLHLTHKCVLPQCDNITRYSEGTTSYICENCSLWNCILCNASHFEISCVMYKSLTPKQVFDKYNFQIEKSKEVIYKKRRQAFCDAQKQDLLVNERVFECFTCLRCIGKMKGVKLRNCFHCICKPCLITCIKSSSDIPVMCPRRNCSCSIEDREVKCILTKDEYNLYERKGLNRAKNKLSNTYQCQQPNCDYFCQFPDETIPKFKCPKCKTNNCLKCKAVHPGLDCSEYQRRTSLNDIHIDESIVKGQIMRCPDCKVLVTKASGCNWIKCPSCNLELCWILRMRRWGPKGRGDISGGCKCTPDKFCHPSCTGCIPDG